MNKTVKYILVIVVVIVVLVVLMSFTSSDSKEVTVKKTEIDKMFEIWLNTAGPGDKMTLLQNQVAIKQDLMDKLSPQELTFLTGYSVALQDMVNSKSTPWSVTFLNSLAYLTTNFAQAKGIVGKTSAANVFGNFGLGKVNV